MGNELITDIVQFCSDVENGYQTEAFYEDVLLYYNFVCNKLEKIEELEREHAFNLQIIETFSIIERKQTFAITEGFLDEVMGLNNVIFNNTDYNKCEILQRTALIAAKFQYKYYKGVLEKILKGEL